MTTSGMNMKMSTSGWVYFAATIFLVVGVLNIIYGLTVLFNADWLVFTPNEILYLNFTTWGWILLFTGVLQVLVGAGALYGQMWARVVGIIVASLSLITAVSILNVYPGWGFLIIALDVLVIYALAVHGAEVAGDVVVDLSTSEAGTQMTDAPSTEKVQ